MSLYVPDFSTNRYEIKYLVPVREVAHIKEHLSDLIHEDSHHSPLNKGYYNHSIYFDDSDFTHYREKHEGQNVRVKVRLRAHKNTPDGQPTKLFLELKHRLNGIGKKDRLVLSEEQAEAILLGRTVPGLSPENAEQNGDDVRSAFFFLSKTTLFRPVVSILYHRAAYHSPLFPNVRLTFDTGVRASSLVSFDCPLSSYRPSIDPRSCVLELKYSKTAPRLIFKRLNELGISQVTLSKYATGVSTIFDQISIINSH